MARFRQIDLDKPYQHHDALEFSDGTVVLVTHLTAGQKATVLQLPAMPAEDRDIRSSAVTLSDEMTECDEAIQ
jgi:hypothetical protein